MATISQLGFEMQRRQKLADALKAQSNGQPVATHSQGIAKLLAGALGGYNQLKADDAERQKKDLQHEALSKALNPSTSRSSMPQILADGGYEDAAIRLATEKPANADVQDLAEQAILKSSKGLPLTADETAAVDAYNRLKGMEVMYDPRQNIVPKYRPLQIASTPSQTASENSLTADQAATGMPADVLPPPRLNEAQPGVAMPTGLDPKAQGQYMDAMAANAAERAANGGLPKMTAEQAQSNVRSTILGDSLQGIEKLLFDPQVSGGNMALGKSVSGVLPDGASQFVQNKILNPKEQLFQSNMAGALESLAGALTGAAFSEEQKRNFTSMLPNGMEDPSIRKQKLVNAYKYAIAVSEGAGAAGLEARQAFGERLQALQQPNTPVEGVEVPPDAAEAVRQAGEGGLVDGPDGKRYRVQGGKLVPQ